METSRFNQVKDWLEYHRNTSEATDARQHDDDSLSEYNRYIKYSYELLDALKKIYQPMTQESPDESNAMLYFIFWTL